jgi:hypothetical protein
MPPLDICRAPLPGQQRHLQQCHPPVPAKYPHPVVLFHLPAQRLEEALRTPAHTLASTAFLIKGSVPAAPHRTAAFRPSCRPDRPTLLPHQHARLLEVWLAEHVCSHWHGG